MARRSYGRPGRDDGVAMVMVMFGLTATLLGIGGVLLHLLGRPPADEPALAGRDAAVAAAVAVRSQALAAGLRASDLDGSDGLDVAAACGRAEKVAGAAAEVVRCSLTATGLVVITARGERAAADGGQAFDSAVVRFVETAPGCLALRTSWGTRLAATCPAKG